MNHLGVGRPMMMASWFAASMTTATPTAHTPGSLDGVVSVNSARLMRPRRAPQSVFRDFEADVEMGAADGDTVIGRISGCVSWLTWLPELIDDTHTIDRVAELIAAALDVGQRLSTERGSKIDAVVMIDRVWLEPLWSNQLGRRIAEQLIDLLLLTPESTLVLVHLGPDANPVGHSAPGEAPGPATDARGPADFEQWRNTDTWWMRPSGPGKA